MGKIDMTTREQELKTKTIETIKHYVNLGNSIFNVCMMTPNVDFTIRGTTCGNYSCKKHTIGVNLILLHENETDYLTETIPHEVAHAFTHYLYQSNNQCGKNYGNKKVMPHGTEWKTIMMKFGKNPTRCHDYNVANAQIRKVERNYVYICNCQTHNLTSIIHKRIQIEKRQYTCKLCKTILIYQEPE